MKERAKGRGVSLFTFSPYHICIIYYGTLEAFGAYTKWSILVAKCVKALYVHHALSAFRSHFRLIDIFERNAIHKHSLWPRTPEVFSCSRIDNSRAQTVLGRANLRLPFNITVLHCTRLSLLHMSLGKLFTVIDTIR